MRSGNRAEMEIREGKIGDRKQIRLVMIPNKRNELRPKDYCW